jgi:hypothetical protein
MKISAINTDSAPVTLMKGIIFLILQFLLYYRLRFNFKKEFLNRIFFEYLHDSCLVTII